MRQTRQMYRVGCSQPCHHWDGEGLRLAEADPCAEIQMATHLHLALEIEQNLDSTEYISNFLGLKFDQPLT